MTIGSQSTRPYTTESESVRLRGEAFYSPNTGGCCTGSASDTGVIVTWTNETSGDSGRASQSARYCRIPFTQAFRVCGHSWGATVPLQMGKNFIRITASSGGNIGRESITVTRIPETTPPAVSSTTPESNAVDVPVNTVITATFSEGMDAATIDTSSFTMVDATGNPVGGSVTYSDKIAYFTPFGDLDYSSSYDGTITSGAKDLSGNSMAADFTWSFTTGAVPDTTAPTVTQEYPANLCPCVDIDTAVTVTFSEEINPLTINTSGFTLIDGSGNRVRSTVTYSGTTARLKPYSNLSYSTTYTATVTTNVRDLSGNSMAADYTWNFSTPLSGTGTWSSISTANAPLGTSSHVAVWTGVEMIVWGGLPTANQVTNTGGRYDPTTDTWQPTSLIDAPSGRYWHTAIWTGTEMIVYSGTTGGKYDPVTDSWQATTTTCTPSGRSRHTAIWTGEKMIVWGGRGSAMSPSLNTGAQYDPVADTWGLTNIVGAPSDRTSHSAVWTGAEMIIWGGWGNDGYLNTGGRFEP